MKEQITAWVKALGLMILISVTFIVAQIFGLIEWHFLLLISPLWVPALALILMFIGAFIYYFLKEMLKK